MPNEPHIFVSVGTTASPEQEEFVRGVEARLRAEGLVPHTVGRDTFSADAPLKTVTSLMKRCSGAVIIALERTYFPAGVTMRGGPREAPLSEICLATPWNQIEATMAYVSGIPLLVIVQSNVRQEGLLEPGYDWYVQRVPLSTASLTTIEFNGVLSNWKQKVAEQGPPNEKAGSPVIDPSQMTIGQLISSLKASQRWAVLAGLITVIAGAFALGARLFPKS